MDASTPSLRSPLTLNLALQGGGAHGAFTWGVLDRLLEEPMLQFEAVSATSSGAMNAIALAHGWLEGGRDGARTALARLWEHVAAQTSMMRWAFAPTVGATGESVLLNLTRYFTPQEINPLGVNPLREIAASLFDFERLRQAAPFRLYIAATRVRDGTLKLFGTSDVTLDALLASTCLPQLFVPVQIDGEIYWDGGYAGNPALEPLVYECRTNILCVLVQPLEQAQPPQSARQIHERISELGFLTTFLREVDFIRRAQSALAGALPLSTIGRRIKSLRIELIEPGESLDAYSAKTRLNTRLAFLHELRATGRERAEAWLGTQAD